MGVSLYAGPVRSDRAAQLDALLVKDWGRALLVVPTHAHATRRRDNILRANSLPGAWGQPVMEITQFVQAILRGEGIAFRRMENFERRLTLENCLHAWKEEHAWADALLQRPGLINHLLRVIVDLKQAAIEPEDFAAALGKDAAPVDEMVSLAYTAYQTVMKETASYDVPGLYWEAAAVAQRGKPQFFSSVDHLLFDGFDDFTPSEFRLLKNLAPHFTHLSVGINLDERAKRADLYALPRRTLDLLRARFETTPISCRLEEPRGYAGFAAEHLFWRDEPLLPDDLVADLRLLPCADERHEIETVLRAIKMLILDQGVAPDDIALVIPALNSSASRVMASATAFGLPLNISCKVPLTNTRVGALVRRFFEAGQEWSRDAVLEMLLSPVLSGDDSFAACPLDLLSRKAQIVKGKAEWRSQLEKLRERYSRARDKDDADELPERIPDAVGCLDGALAQLTDMARAVDSFPISGTLAAFAGALREVLDTWNWPAFFASLPGDAAREAERGALTAIRVTLGKVSAHAELARQYARNEGVRALLQILQESTVAAPGVRGGVHVREPSQVRNLQFDHVFFIGLNEGVLPSAAPLNAIYGEADIQRLKKRDLPLNGRDTHGDEQRLLFHHALATAQASLTLTWRVASGGREATPSPFITEIESMFKGRGVVGAAPGADSFLPSPGGVASAREARSAGVLTPPLRKVWPEGFALIDAAIAIERDRFSNDSFSVHDGVLDDADARGKLADRFDTGHLFSVNQVETYRNCPFQFFSERVMRIEDEEAPEAEFDPRVRGTILHDALQAFHQNYVGVPVSEIPAGEGMKTMRASLDAVFEAQAWKSVAAPPGVLRAERTYLEMVLRRYFFVERAREDAPLWQPRHFEVLFGPDRRGESGAFPDPFALATEGGPVLFTGRIDRIDHTDGGTGDVYRLVDYKTGSTPAQKDIDEGFNIQLVLYALATEHNLFPGSMCEEAVYLPVGKEKRTEALFRNPKRGKPKWAERQEAATQGVVDALNGIRGGWFPPERRGSSCYGCGQAHACRYNQRRVDRKRAVSAGRVDEVD